jgi:hypothetical protein
LEPDTIDFATVGADHVDETLCPVDLGVDITRAGVAVVDVAGIVRFVVLVGAVAGDWWRDGPVVVNVVVIVVEFDIWICCLRGLKCYYSVLGALVPLLVKHYDVREWMDALTR